MDAIVYLNGSFLPMSEARVPVLDRGFIFGDGVYEVVPAYDRVPFRWPEHYARLERSLAKVRIGNPMAAERWAALVTELLSRHPWSDQFVYIQVTRGVARRDHAFPVDATPTVFAMANELKPPPPEAIAAGVKCITLPDERWLHCDIKTVSLLGNVLARQAAAEAGALECIQLRDGFVTEGAASNVWVVRDSTLLSPPRDRRILHGIRLGLIDELAAAAGISHRITPIPESDLRVADEVLLSSATKEVLPVTELDGKPVADGQPGPVFRRLHAAYQAAKVASTERGAAAAVASSQGGIAAAASAAATQQPRNGA